MVRYAKQTRSKQSAKWHFEEAHRKDVVAQGAVTNKKHGAPTQTSSYLQHSRAGEQRRNGELSRRHGQRTREENKNAVGILMRRTTKKHGVIQSRMAKIVRPTYNKRTKRTGCRLTTARRSVVGRASWRRRAPHARRWLDGETGSKIVDARHPL